MLKIRIIPIILKKSAVVVKGKKFSKSRVVGPLLPILRVYQSRDIDELVIIDVSPINKINSSKRYDWLSQVTSFTTMPLSVGGGIQTVEQASKIIELGADKVILNNAIINKKSLIKDIANKHGSQSIISSIDAVKVGNSFVAYDSWNNKITGVDVIDLIKTSEKYGSGEILITSFDKEGCQMGFDEDLVDYFGSHVNLPLIINGGAGNKEDFLSIINYANSKKINVEGLAAGSCFHFTSLTPYQVSGYLYGANIPVRHNKKNI